MIEFKKPLQGRYIENPLMYRIPFPHFTKEEADVLRRFIEAGLIKGKWYFDVRLTSQKAKFVEKLPSPWAWMWQQLTAKRIDAVCVSENAVHIIEVKRYMLSSGVGQLITYRDMFIKEYEPSGPVVLWYVTFYHDPDIVRLCESLNINTWYVV